MNKETSDFRVVLGTTVDEQTAEKFRAKCEPFNTVDIIGAFVDMVISGEVEIVKKEKENEND